MPRDSPIMHSAPWHLAYKSHDTHHNQPQVQPSSTDCQRSAEGDHAPLQGSRQSHPSPSPLCYIRFSWTYYGCVVLKSLRPRRPGRHSRLRVLLSGPCPKSLVRWRRTLTRAAQGCAPVVGRKPCVLSRCDKRHQQREERDCTSRDRVASPRPVARVGATGESGRRSLLHSQRGAEHHIHTAPRARTTATTMETGARRLAGSGDAPSVVTFEMIAVLTVASVMVLQFGTHLLDSRALGHAHTQEFIAMMYKVRCVAVPCGLWR